MAFTSFQATTRLEEDHLWRWDEACWTGSFVCFFACDLCTYLLILLHVDTGSQRRWLGGEKTILCSYGSMRLSLLARLSIKMGCCPVML
jgi:hypothetical protein